MNNVTLVDGKCPACDTQVEHVIDGSRVRFIPHDDPEWCRWAAVEHSRRLKRALEQVGQERALAQYREAFYRNAFAFALKELAHQSEGISALDDHEWRAIIEHRIREHNGIATERDAVAAVMAISGDESKGRAR